METTKKVDFGWLASRALIVLASGWFISLLFGPLVALRNLTNGMASWCFFSWCPLSGLVGVAYMIDVVVYGVFFLLIWLIARRVFR